MSGQRAASFHSIRSIIRKERGCRWCGGGPLFTLAPLPFWWIGVVLIFIFQSPTHSLTPSNSVVSVPPRRRVSLLCFHFLPHPEGCPRTLRLSPRLKCIGELGRWMPRARQVLCQCCQVEGFISDQQMRMGDALTFIPCTHAHSLSTFRIGFHHHRQRHWFTEQRRFCLRLVLFQRTFCG